MVSSAANRVVSASFLLGLLYSYTVFCIVYPLRRGGERLPKEAVRAGGKRGWLTFSKMPAGQPVMIARVSGQGGGEVYPQLAHATIKVVDGGILIQGWVMGGGNQVRQSWWCEPCTAEGLERPANARPKDGRRG